MRITKIGMWLATALFVCASSVQAQQPVSGGSARLEAWQRHQAMAESSPFKSLEWQRMGPKFVGGRIESIDAPRGRPGTIYVGVGAGGIWKTINGGLTFEPIFEHESTFAIGDLTVAPSEPETAALLPVAESYESDEHRQDHHHCRQGQQQLHHIQGGNDFLTDQVHGR